MLMEGAIKKEMNWKDCGGGNWFILLILTPLQLWWKIRQNLIMRVDSFWVYGPVSRVNGECEAYVATYRLRNLFLEEIDEIIKRNGWQVFHSIIKCLNLDGFWVLKISQLYVFIEDDHTIGNWFHVIQTLQSLIVNKTVI